MATYVVLLRNVNVGGLRMTMPALRQVFGEAGCRDVRTYLQSGNVVFRSDAMPDALTEDLEARVAAAAGFRAAVLLRTHEEIAAVAADPPWPGEGLDPAQVVVAFCRFEPPREAVGELRRLAVDGEDATVRGREVLLRLPHGQGRSKLAAAVGRTDLGGPVTARNWRTVTKVAELAEAVSAAAR